MGRLAKERASDKARAGPSGGINWNIEIIAVWFGPAAGEECCNNGEVRPARYFRFQHENNDTRGENNECDITNRRGDKIEKQDKRVQPISVESFFIFLLTYDNNNRDAVGPSRLFLDEP